jgi:D-aminoacyl-tRNA deacylase
MRAVIQKVTNASVEINGKIHAEIGPGLLVFLGIEEADVDEDIDWLAGKICRLRVFDDEHGVMNLSLQDVGGEIMVISQFTLHASTKKGNRPSYIHAAKPEQAIPLYEAFIKKMATESDCIVRSGEFGAYMKIRLENDGPVTIIIDSKAKW